VIKVLSADQIKAWDAFTIREEPIASIDLMERACQAFVAWFVDRYDASHKIELFVERVIMVVMD
jgi:NAD(P)H-hydrate repair Nnr-like enzyme with NAD(P)H-hydrate epimerase domain